VRKEKHSYENNLRRSSFKLVEQAVSGPKEKEQVIEKLDRAERELKKTPQETAILTGPESRWKK